VGWDDSFISRGGARPPGEANVRNDGYIISINVSINLEFRQQQTRSQLTLPAQTMIQDVNSAFLPNQSVLNCRSTAIHGCTAADVSPAPTPPPSLVPYTNRPFGHQRRCTKRLTIVSFCVGPRTSGRRTPTHRCSVLFARWLSSADLPDGYRNCFRRRWMKTLLSIQVSCGRKYTWHLN